MNQEQRFHILLFINETLQLEYYLSSNARPIKKELGEKESATTIVVNYDLQNKNSQTIQKVQLTDAIFYEINFEKAYTFLYGMPKNEYTKLEQHFFHLMKLFCKETASELIEFLKETNSLSKESLLEIETNFNHQKSAILKNRLLQKAT